LILCNNYNLEFFSALFETLLFLGWYTSVRGRVGLEPVVRPLSFSSPRSGLGLLSEWISSVYFWVGILWASHEETQWQSGPHTSFVTFVKENCPHPNLQRPYPPALTIPPSIYFSSRNLQWWWKIYHDFPYPIAWRLSINYSPTGTHTYSFLTKEHEKSPTLICPRLSINSVKPSKKEEKIKTTNPFSHFVFFSFFLFFFSHSYLKGTFNLKPFTQIKTNNQDTTSWLMARWVWLPGASGSGSVS
jgi:hypothetical protein